MCDLGAQACIDSVNSYVALRRCTKHTTFHLLADVVWTTGEQTHTERSKTRDNSNNPSANSLPRFLCYRSSGQNVLHEARSQTRNSVSRTNVFGRPTFCQSIAVTQRRRIRDWLLINVGVIFDSNTSYSST